MSGPLTITDEKLQEILRTIRGLYYQPTLTEIRQKISELHPEIDVQQVRNATERRVSHLVTKGYLVRIPASKYRKRELFEITPKGLRVMLREQTAMR